MDVLKSFAIPYKGLGEGKHRFAYELDQRFFQAFEGSPISDGKGHVEVELTKAATFLSLEVAIRGEVVVECDRCLGNCILPVDYRGGFKVRFGDVEEDFDGEIMWLPGSESTLNLAQYIYESIVLSLPYRKVHPDRADGSPGCDAQSLGGVKLLSEQEFQKAEHNSHVRRMDQDPEWSKLDQLRSRLAKEEREKGPQKEK